MPKHSDEIDASRQIALDKALSDITKRYGDGSIMRLGEAHQLQVESIPTGALSLDIALGVGGIPRGASQKFMVQASGENNDLSTQSLQRRKTRWNSSIYRYGARPGPCFMPHAAVSISKPF